MYEQVLEYKKKFKLFLSSYGKVSALLFLFGVSLLIVSLLIHSIAPKKLKVSFLDVGQGDAILIQTPGGHDMLIDGGGTDKVLEKLSKQMSYFDRGIDVVVATHPDADHITGLIPVLKKYQVKQIITSPLSGHTGISETLEKSINDEHAEVRVAQKGDQIIFGDGVVAHVLYPTKNIHVSKSETNDASVSIVITYGDESVLLTGDLATTYEGALLGGALPKNITIYKAGHHGSKYSSGEQLLSYIKPEYSVISAGKDNKYGHPNQEALSRLETYSREILSTIEKGTITFFLDGKSLSVSTEK